MDSLTQCTLGAAIGQLTLGKQLGKKATWLGACAGTIPDLDSLILSACDTVTQLVHHRGISHSLLFGLLAPLILSWAYQRHASFWRWYAFWSLTFITHSLLDCFTSWGTQLFWPHPYRVAWHAIFIIDPFYTLPLLIGVVQSYRLSVLRPVIIGLMVSSFYLLTCLGVKHHVNTIFERALAKHHISTIQFITKPTPFNILLWSMIAETSQQYAYGYYSLFDRNLPKSFTMSQPKQHDLLMDGPLVDLATFTQGYYILTHPVPDTITMHDARYGRFGGWDPTYPGQYVFNYHCNITTQHCHQTRPKFYSISSLMQSLGQRIIQDLRKPAR